MRITTKKIKTNDFPQEYKTLIEKLGFSLNPLFDQLEQAFNKRIDVDNLRGLEYKTLDIEVDGLGIPKSNATLLTELDNFKGFDVIQVTDLTGASTRPTATPFVTWDLNNKTITIRHIAALPANIKFRLVLRSNG